MTVNYREAYGIYACNGILFNHESPVRGETFVTRKITRAVANISLGFQKTLSLGNLNAKRDWGHAADYVEAMYLMLQQDIPEDYVIATGKTTTVRSFVDHAFREVGIHLQFDGSGPTEKGTIIDIDEVRFELHTGVKPDHLFIGQTIVQVDPFYYRPTEVDLLIGDPTKAKKQLGWEAKYTVSDLVTEMVESDLIEVKRNHLLKSNGFEIISNVEEIA